MPASHDDGVDDDDVCDNFFQELLDKESLSPTLDIGCEQLHLQSSIFTQIHKYIWMTWPKCVAEMQLGLLAKKRAAADGYHAA